MQNTLTIAEIDATLDRITNKSWFSWAAHYDTQRHCVYWGSDFIIQVSRTTTVSDIVSALDYYIDNRMAVR